MSINKSDAKGLMKQLKDIGLTYKKGKPNIKGLKKFEQQLRKEGLAPQYPKGFDQFIIFGGISGEFGDACTPIEVPYIAPKFKLEWGDGPSDQIETHDNEVLYISACNTYQNIRFNGLTIKQVWVFPNSTLPNGDPTVQIHTSEGICYGDIDPCSCTKRDYMLTVQNAAQGNYFVVIQYELKSIELLSNLFPYDYFPIQLINS
ncbi:MAG: hypothetical protein JKY22_03290 [Flavobacteriaceae bacterium]|nr:hypothetical protein [Flavobacteriaceae bacterium]